MQKGRIELRGKRWLLRYWEPVIENGVTKNRQRAQKIAEYSKEFNTKEKVEHLAQRILGPINARTAQPQSIDTVAHFLENVYMPYVKGTLRPVTHASYRIMHKLVEPHLGDIKLCDFRTKDAQRVLDAIVDSKPRTVTSVRNAKNFLRGAFRHAKITGALSGENPVAEAKVPFKRCLPKGQTYAYSLVEIQKMLAALEEPTKTAVLMFALSGLRLSEIKGLKWSDYHDGALYVSRSVWQGHVVEDTKTPASRAPVPVVPIVAKALEQHRKRSAGEWMFPGPKSGKPVRFENLMKREVRPALQEAGVTWHGWHAFRRGLGTNLNLLDVDDKTIQIILRHANVATTQGFYIKVPPPEAKAAMRQLENAFKKAWIKKTA